MDGGVEMGALRELLGVQPGKNSKRQLTNPDVCLVAHGVLITVSLFTPPRTPGVFFVSTQGRLNLCKSSCRVRRLDVEPSEHQSQEDWSLP